MWPSQVIHLTAAHLLVALLAGQPDSKLHSRCVVLEWWQTPSSPNCCHSGHSLHPVVLWEVSTWLQICLGNISHPLKHSFPNHLLLFIIFDNFQTLGKHLVPIHCEYYWIDILDWFWDAGKCQDINVKNLYFLHSQAFRSYEMRNILVPFDRHIFQNSVSIGGPLDFSTF